MSLAGAPLSVFCSAAPPPKGLVLSNHWAHNSPCQPSEESLGSILFARWRGEMKLADTARTLCCCPGNSQHLPLYSEQLEPQAEAGSKSADSDEEKYFHRE